MLLICGDYVGACDSVNGMESLYLSTLFSYYGVLNVTKSTTLMAGKDEYDYSKIVRRSLEMYHWQLDQSVELICLLGMHPIYNSIGSELLVDLSLTTLENVGLLFGNGNEQGILAQKMGLLNMSGEDFGRLVKSCGYSAEKRSAHQSAIQVYMVLSMRDDVIRVLSAYLGQSLSECISFKKELNPEMYKYAKGILGENGGDQANVHWCGVMIGLHEFWLAYQARTWTEAVQIIDLLCLFPVKEDLESVNEKTVVNWGNDIASVMGGVCLAYMESMLGCWEIGYRDGLKARASALILFTSGINVCL